MRQLIPALLVALAACTPSTHQPEPEGSTGAAGSTGEASTGSTGLDSASGDGSTSGSPSGTSSSDEGSSGTTGDPEACLLPGDGSWCSAALEAAQAVGCSTAPTPAHCYATIAAQYGHDPALLQAADCLPRAPGCAAAQAACEREPAAECSTWTLADCVAAALAAGVTQAQATPTCEALLELYGEAVDAGLDTTAGPETDGLDSTGS